MVDLVVFALLVSSDLSLRLFAQVADAADLRALPHRVFHRLGKRQASFTDPLVQTSVD